MKSEETVKQGVGEQCDETFVLANVEEVVTENGPSGNVSLDAKEKTEYTSDEDVEVDIDGSDNEEQHNHLIPGKYSFSLFLSL